MFKPKSNTPTEEREVSNTPTESGMERERYCVHEYKCNHKCVTYYAQIKSHVNANSTISMYHPVLPLKIYSWVTKICTLV